MNSKGWIWYVFQTNSGSIQLLFAKRKEHCLIHLTKEQGLALKEMIEDCTKVDWEKFEEYHEG